MDAIGLQPLVRSRVKLYEEEDENDGLGYLKQKMRIKQMSTMVLVSSLMLNVAGAGLFSAADLEDSICAHAVVVFFCVSVFSFMSASIMSGAFMLLLMRGLAPQKIKSKFGRLTAAPQLYFVMGYIFMVLGTTAYFLAERLTVGSTGLCLAFCASLFILPTFAVLGQTLVISHEAAPPKS